MLISIFLAGCAVAPTISNIGAPGSAKNVAIKTIGTRSALTYISNLSVEESCAAQIKIMTEAKWTEKEAVSKETTYVKSTYTDGKDDMVVLCSETELSATEKATKVTLTLMQ